MKKSDRIAIVVSIIWPLLVIFLNTPWSPEYYRDETSAGLWGIVFWIGIFPVLLYWGYWFITKYKGDSDV